MKQRRAWLLTAGSAGLALLAGVGAGLYRMGLIGTSANEQNGATTTGPAELLYTLTFADATGKPTVLNDYRGKITVLNFWATWCAPCVEEIPEFSSVQNALRPKGVEFLGIAIDNAQNVAQFAAKIPASYPLLVAGNQGSELARLFGNTAGGLPFTIVLDQAGLIRASRLGRVHAGELHTMLAPLLSKR